MAIRELMAFKIDNMYFSLVYWVNVYFLTHNLNKNETVHYSEGEKPLSK